MAAQLPERLVVSQFELKIEPGEPCDNSSANYAGAKGPDHYCSRFGSESDPVIGSRSIFFNKRLVGCSPSEANDEIARDYRHKENADRKLRSRSQFDFPPPAA